MTPLIQIVPFETEKNFEADFPFLLPQEQEQVRENRLSGVQKRTLAGHVLVRKKIMGDYGLSQPPLFMFLPQGKPCFADYPRFHFNISHTEDLVAVAFSDSPIGIDVEHVRHAKERVAKRFFHEEEYQTLMQQPLEKQDEYFTALWVLKEAYVKCTGEGIANHFDKFSIHIDNMQADIRGNTVPVKLTVWQHADDIFVGLCEQTD